MFAGPDYRGGELIRTLGLWDFGSDFRTLSLLHRQDYLLTYSITLALSTGNEHFKLFKKYIFKVYFSEVVYSYLL